MYNRTRNICDMLKKDYKRGRDVEMVMGPLIKYAGLTDPSCPFKVFFFFCKKEKII